MKERVICTDDRQLGFIMKFMYMRGKPEFSVGPNEEDDINLVQNDAGHLEYRIRTTLSDEDNKLLKVLLETIKEYGNEEE